MDSHEDIRKHGMAAVVALLADDRVPVVSLALKTLILLVVKSGRSILFCFLSSNINLTMSHETETNKNSAKQLGLVPKATALTSSPNKAVAAASQKLLSLAA